MIDAHRIAPKLWMGSRPSPAACKVFDVIVLAAEEHQPDLPDVHVVRAPIDDAKPTPREVELALRAAKVVNLQRRKGRRVLVSCYMGVNRSGLVTALALMLNGSSAQSAIRRIRAARKVDGYTPLSNPHFVALLKHLEPVLEERHARGVV